MNNLIGTMEHDRAINQEVNNVDWWRCIAFHGRFISGRLMIYRPALARLINGRFIE